jgi:nucleoporin NUP159
VSWSPRGKQLAIALQSGDTVTYSPMASDSPKTTIPKPQSVAGNRVLSTTWLANPTFFTVYAPVGPLEPKTTQSHYVVDFDSKSNTATDISLSAPYFPFPGLRNPGAFVLVFRNWDPLKFLLVVGDGTSQEIGSVGCYMEASGEVWYNLNVDEAYTPSLPLDRDMNDTVLLGLDLDLTATKQYDHLSTSGEKVEVPPPPIMYAYSSDGTLIGWYVVNGTAKMYPGMKNAAAESSIDAPMSVTPAPSTMNEEHPSAFGITQPSTGFGGLGKSSQPTFGSTGFGQSSSPPSAFSSGTKTGGFAGFADGGNLSGFSQPSFSQTGFGQSSQSSTFGQAQASNVFGQSPVPTLVQTTQPSVFGQTDQSSFLKPPSFGQLTFGQTSAFGSSGTSGGGFGAFANNNTNFDSSSTLQALNSSFGDTQGGLKTSEMIREVSMGIDSGDGGFGGLSLGGDGESKPVQGKDQGGLFGVAVTQPSSALAFGSSTVSSSFGAFSNWNQTKLDTPSPSNTQKDAPKPASEFGQTGFGIKSTPAFGQPAFGSTSSFVQASFGTSTPSPFVTPSSGGFGAWSDAASSLLAPGTSAPAKPVQLDEGGSQVESKTEPKSATSPREKLDLTALRDQPKLEPSTPSKSQQEVSAPSPASSPESPKPPASIRATSSSPFERSPSPLPLGKSTADNPTPVGGAFANLKQSTLSLGDSVFGAPDKNSPFFKPIQTTPTTTPANVSAFNAPVTTSPTPSTTTPVFGRSSVFGHPTPSTTPKTPAISNPVTGGFSAFASSTSPFGKVDGTGKSFSDLLKTPDKTQEPSKPIQRPAVFSLPDPTEKDEPSKTPTKTSPAASTVFSLAALTPPPDLSSLGLGIPSSDTEHQSGDEYSEDGSSQQSGEDGEEEGTEQGEGEYGEDIEEYGSDSESGSFLDESLSYEDIGAHLDEEEIEGPHELSPVAEETTLPLESGDEGDTTQNPRKKPTTDPTKIALPASRESSMQPDSRSSSSSPSVTPRSTNAKLPSPEATSVQQSCEPSTTPPSTPAKPSPNLPVPATSSYGIGLGRPSAKPTRSSPLTGDPISGQDAPKHPLPIVTPPLPKARPASPKVAFGQWESQRRKPDLSKIQPLSLGTSFTNTMSEPTKTPLFGAVSTLVTTPSLFGKLGEAPPPQPTLGGEFIGEQDEVPTQASPSNFFRKPLVPAQSTHGGLFGKPTAESSPPPKEATRTLGHPNKPLSVPQTPETQVKSAFLLTTSKRSPATPPAVTPKPVQQQIPEPSPAEGLQAECQYLYLSMNKDIEEVRNRVVLT